MTPSEPEPSATRRSSSPVASTTTQALWEVLERRPLTIWSPATLDERTANAHEQREVAERLGDRHFRLGAALNLVVAATCRGDLVEVDKNFDVMIRVAAEAGLARARGSAATHLSWRQLLAGHIDEAEQAAGEALQIASQAGDPNGFPSYAAQIYAIRRAQGRLDEIIELIEQAVSEESRATRVSSGSRRRPLRQSTDSTTLESSSSRLPPTDSPNSPSISHGSPP